jgi:hypothetical protein
MRFPFSDQAGCTASPRREMSLLSRREEVLRGRRPLLPSSVAHRGSLGTERVHPEVAPRRPLAATLRGRVPHARGRESVASALAPGKPRGNQVAELVGEDEGPRAGSAAYEAYFLTTSGGRLPAPWPECGVWAPTEDAGAKAASRREERRHHDRGGRARDGACSWRPGRSPSTRSAAEVAVAGPRPLEL